MVNPITIKFPMAANPDHETWQPPPELRHSLPRPVRLTRTGSMYAIFGAFFLVAAIGIGWVTDSPSEAWDRVEQQGSTTDATITRLWIGGGKSRTPMVSYRFMAGAAEIAGKSSVRQKVWKGLHTGDLLAIRYVAMAPDLNHPAHGASPPAPAWLVFLAILWPSIVFCTIVYRERQLLSLGFAARAIVTEVRRDKFGRGGRQKKFRIRGSFTPAGQHAVTATFNRRTAPVVGTEVCLLYDPDNPRRNAVYPLESVRVREE
jgi:hypothetical protein